MRILYIPIDERPCNAIYPAKLAETLPDVELVAPSASLLGHYRDGADVDALWRFVKEALPSCDQAILSVDMLVYGGLIPSRIHEHSQQELMRRADHFVTLRALNPAAQLHVNAMIMRVPGYNSALEEPLYYEQHGQNIFRISCLRDKLARGMGEAGEEAELAQLEGGDVPIEVVNDYFGRRAKNAEVTAHVLSLVAQGLLGDMVIPQDDTAVYGVQSGEQARHMDAARAMGILNKLLCYPGADEVGMTLLSRAVNDLYGKVPAVYVRYASVLGPSIVPSYEDRPYGESIKAHILASGCRLTHSEGESDFVLMVNTPGTVCSEAEQQQNAPRTNLSHRSLAEFVQAITHYQSQGRIVTVSDAAYSNGADLELFERLQGANALRSLHGYAGWNTHCNTLGTALCCGVMAAHGGDTHTFIAERLLEDVGYMTQVRPTLRAGVASGMWTEALYAQQDGPLVGAAKEGLQAFWQEHIAPYVSVKGKVARVYFPWSRAFEAYFDMDYEA